MNVLSIQSHVTFGHVGNAAAAFPLQRLGFEVWRINTVQFSNHTGYGAWTGEVFGAQHIREVVQGIVKLVGVQVDVARLGTHVAPADARPVLGHHGRDRRQGRLLRVRRAHDVPVG